MNDHNLDDLIIDNIDPKNSKTKSFLTIIALAIVVLIVAIILTKIILKDPHAKLAVEEENNVELISPELTLQSVTKKEPIKEEPSKVEPLKKELTQHTDEKKKPVTVSPKQTTKVKPATVAITQEFSQEASSTMKNEQEAKIAAQNKVAELKKAQAAKIAQEKKAAQLKKEKALEAERLAKIKAAQEAKKVVPATNSYFIQVGSFTQTPSSRFLSVIKNSGFNYQITPASSTGTKKLLIGPYPSRAEVDTALVRVRDRINKSAFVVKK
ncbi:MAG TPA: hypothetical protein ENK98_04050 [Epsilonproteobacteria bacterium]|nr:hypothetical protein [Campylobacterota bacterium]HHD78795.1 hypothetical protein [Campylobacterota bacterium]